MILACPLWVISRRLAVQSSCPLYRKEQRTRREGKRKADIGHIHAVARFKLDSINFRLGDAAGCDSEYVRGAGVRRPLIGSVPSC